MDYLEKVYAAKLNKVVEERRRKEEAAKRRNNKVNATLEETKEEREDTF